jgi:aminomethyltransferase
MNRTPLYDMHRSLGARMVEFAGWEMPVQYTGILDEHEAVRTNAGLFDVSHMGEVEVRGPRALEVCQQLTVNDVGRLRDGEAQYSVMCLPSGGAVDDVIVYRFAADRYLFCVNAGNRAVDISWMREQGGGAEIIDRGDEFAQLALQGPRAVEILSRLTNLRVAEIPSFAFAEGEVAGRRAMVARTGYTGEDGFELYCAPRDAPPQWEALMEAGQAAGLRPTGLGARDTLRLEAALALYGHELTRETTPLEARLGWVVKLDKGEFIGRSALLRQKQQGPARRLVGLRMSEPGIPRQGYPVFAGEERTGTVTSGTKSPTLGSAIGLAYVDSAHAATGAHLGVEIRGRKIAAEIVPVPFYKRPLTAIRDQ